MNQDPVRRARLETWKEIGAFLGRTERTAKRWEVERELPVRRVPGGGRAQVYAFVDELTAWLAHAPQDSEPGSIAPEPAVEPVPAPEPPSTSPSDPRSRASGRRSRLLLVCGGLLMAGMVMLASARWWSAPSTLKGPAGSASAVETYLTLRGEYYFNKRTPDSLRTARSLFQQAVQKSPNDAHAYVGLSKTYNLMREFTLMSPGKPTPRRWPRRSAPSSWTTGSPMRTARSAL